MGRDSGFRSSDCGNSGRVGRYFGYKTKDASGGLGCQTLLLLIMQTPACLDEEGFGFVVEIMALIDYPPYSVLAV